MVQAIPTSFVKGVGGMGGSLLNMYVTTTTRPQQPPSGGERPMEGVSFFIIGAARTLPIWGPPLRDIAVQEQGEHPPTNAEYIRQDRGHPVVEDTKLKGSDQTGMGRYSRGRPAGRALESAPS